jgi:mono/diheme cytochrome c family protein
MNRTLFASLAGLLAACVIGYLAYSQQPTSDGTSDLGVPMVDVVVPDLGSDERAGEVAFISFCAECHGRNAGGRDGYGPPLVHEIYEPSHHADISFLYAPTVGVRAHHWPYGNMPSIPGITQYETALVLKYVRALQAANGIE